MGAWRALTRIWAKPPLRGVSGRLSVVSCAEGEAGGEGLVARGLVRKWGSLHF